MRPTLSVLMPVFNDAEYVQSAIESVLTQSFSDFEFIIINDGSTDETPAILEAAAKRDERIRLYHQENHGISFTRNCLIERAHGRFLANMDGDDISVPERFDVQIKHLHQHPKVDITGTQLAYIDSKGKPTDKSVTTTPTDAPSIAWRLLFGMCVFHATWCVRREVLQSEKYSPECSVGEDYDLIARLSRSYIIDNVDLPLYKVRESPSRISNDKADEQSTTARSVMHREHRVLLGDDYDRVLSEALIQDQAGNLDCVWYATLLAVRLANRNGYGSRQRAIILRRLYDQIACSGNANMFHKIAAFVLGRVHRSLYTMRAALPMDL